MSNWKNGNIIFWQTITPEIMQNCLDNGESVYVIHERNRRTPLHHAAMHSNNLEVIRAFVDIDTELLEKRDEHMFTPLLSAIWYNNNNLEIAKELICKGADVNARGSRNNSTALDLAQSTRNDEFIAYIRETIANANR